MLSKGLYSVKFRTPRGEGAGVIVLQEDGKLVGGDTSIAYIGTYNQSGDEFTASVQTKRHAPGLPSVFGIDGVTIQLKGKSSGASAQCNGTASQAPGVTFQASLTKID